MAKSFELQSVDYEAIQTVIAGSDVVAGEHDTVGLLNGFYFTDAAIGETATFITKAEQVKVVKTGAQVWAAGAAIYVIVATDVCTTTVGANVLIGYAHEAALSADVVGWISLDGEASYLKA